MSASCAGPRGPATFYVTMLNGMDRELTLRGIKTKLVFIVYGDLLWPPRKERLENPERFVMMLAFGRDYDQPYDVSALHLQMPPFTLNGNPVPRNSREVMPFYNAWRKLFRGDVFLYDYHLIGYDYFDPGQAALSKVLAEDIRLLDKLRIGGYVSCQAIRGFLPTSYPPSGLSGSADQRPSVIVKGAPVMCQRVPPPTTQKYTLTPHILS